MRTPLTETQLKFMYAQSDKMTAREIGKGMGLKGYTVTIACRKMGVIPLRHSLKPRFTSL
jgi:hypothetical protein